MEPLVIPDINYVESHPILLAKDPNERERYKRRRPPLHVRVMEYANEVCYNFRGEPIPIKWRYHQYPPEEVKNPRRVVKFKYHKQWRRYYFHDVQGLQGMHKLEDGNWLLPLRILRNEERSLCTMCRFIPRTGVISFQPPILPTLPPLRAMEPKATYSDIDDATTIPTQAGSELGMRVADRLNLFTLALAEEASPTEIVMAFFGDPEGPVEVEAVDEYEAVLLGNVCAIICAFNYSNDFQVCDADEGVSAEAKTQLLDLFTNFYPGLLERVLDLNLLVRVADVDWLGVYTQPSESKVEGTFYSANAGKEIGDSVRFQELKEESNTRRNSMEGEVHRSSVGSNEEEEREWTTIEPESIVDFEESPTTNEVSIAVERLQRLPNIEGERHYLKIAFPTRVMKEEFVELLHKLYMRRIDQAEQEVDSLQETYGVKTTYAFPVFPETEPAAQALTAESMDMPTVFLPLRLSNRGEAGGFMRQYALNVPMLEREVPEAYKWLCEHRPHLRLRVDPELEEEREIDLMVGMWTRAIQIDWAGLSVERFDEQFKAHPDLCSFLAHLNLFDVVDISSSKGTVMGFRSRHYLGMYHTVILEEEAAQNLEEVLTAIVVYNRVVSMGRILDAVHGDGPHVQFAMEGLSPVTLHMRTQKQARRFLTMLVAVDTPPETIEEEHAQLRDLALATYAPPERTLSIDELQVQHFEDVSVLMSFVGVLTCRVGTKEFSSTINKEDLSLDLSPVNVVFDWRDVWNVVTTGDPNHCRLLHLNCEPVFLQTSKPEVFAAFLKLAAAYVNWNLQDQNVHEIEDVVAKFSIIQGPDDFSVDVASHKTTIKSIGGPRKDYTFAFESRLENEIFSRNILEIVEQRRKLLSEEAPEAGDLRPVTPLQPTDIMLGPAIYLSRCLPEALTCTYGRVFKLRILPESVVMDVTFDHKRVALEVHNLDDIDTESLHIHVLEDNFILLESVADVKFINLQHIEIVFMRDKNRLFRLFAFQQFDGAAVASLLKAIQAFNFTCHFSAMTSDPDREIGVDTGSLDAFDIPYHGQMGSGDIRLQPEGVTITGPLDRFAVVNQSFIELDSLLSFSRTSSQCNMVFRGQYPVVLDLETNERCRPFMHNLREYFIYEPLRFAKPEPPLPAVALRSRGLEMAQHQRQYVNQSSPLAKSEDFTIQIRFGDEESALGDWIPGLTGLKDGQLYLSPPEGEISTETTELQLHTLEPRCVHWDPVRECYSLRDLIAVNKVSSDTVENYSATTGSKNLLRLRSFADSIVVFIRIPEMNKLHVSAFLLSSLIVSQAITNYLKTFVIYNSCAGLALGNLPLAQSAESLQPLFQELWEKETDSLLDLVGRRVMAAFPSGLSQPCKFESFPLRITYNEGGSFSMLNAISVKLRGTKDVLFGSALPNVIGTEINGCVQFQGGSPAVSLRNVLNLVMKTNKLRHRWAV